MSILIQQRMQKLVVLEQYNEKTVVKKTLKNTHKRLVLYH